MQRINRTLDAMAYAIAPEWGARRMAIRRVFEQQDDRARKIKQSALESAENDRLREGRWLTSRLSTDAFLESDLSDTRRRSRELYRNDFVGGAIDSRVEHAVGTGFTVQARITAVDGIVSDAEAEQFNQELETVYSRVSPTICRTRKRSLWQKTSLFARCLDTDGEALAVFSDIGETDIPLPLAIEIVDVDRLETPPNKSTDPLCRMGIQYDAQKRIAGYWIRKNHPNDNKEFGLEYAFVQADRVCHAFVEWFAGQSRGLPWMTRSLNRAKDGKDLSEAGIIAAQVEACYAVFIKTKANPLRKAVGAATGSESDGARLQDVRPGQAHYLSSDEDIVFSNPTKSNSVGTLQEYNNRTIAAGCNWPYEMMLKDWRGVSFAGGRIVLHGAKMSTRVRQKLIAESFLIPFWNRMVDEAVILGECSIDPRVYRDYKHLFRQHTWTAPRWSYAINPGEEVDAKVKEIDNNLETLADALAENQLDLETVLAQRSKERQMERDGECVPTLYGNVAAQMGGQQPQPQPDGQQDPRDSADSVDVTDPVESET